MHPAVKTVILLVAATGVSLSAVVLDDARAKPAGHLTSHTFHSQGPLTLHARTASPYAAIGPRETDVAIEVDAVHIAEAARASLRVALVIDSSGSMTGNRLRHAKRAAREFIAALRPIDEFSLVTYDDDANTLLTTSAATDRTKRRAFALIDAIYADGGTALSAGLTVGAALARSANHLSRVVLISDGRANVGVTNARRLGTLAQQIADSGVSISTIGVGTDFREKVIQRIATAGRGQYYFAESATSLERILAAELTALRETIAKNLTAIVTPTHGVKVVGTYNGYGLRRVGASTLIPMADLRVGGHHTLVVRLRHQLAAGVWPLADVTLSFKALNGQEHKAKVAIVVAGTDDNSLLNSNLNYHAITTIERARTATAINHATDLYERGDTQRAKKILRDRNRAARKRAHDMRNPRLAAEVKAATNRANTTFDEGASRTELSSVRRAAKKNRYNAYRLMNTNKRWKLE